MDRLERRWDPLLRWPASWAAAALMFGCGGQPTPTAATTARDIAGSGACDLVSTSLDLLGPPSPFPKVVVTGAAVLHAVEVNARSAPVHWIQRQATLLPQEAERIRADACAEIARYGSGEHQLASPDRRAGGEVFVDVVTVGAKLSLTSTSVDAVAADPLVADLRIVVRAHFGSDLLDLRTS